jgi:tetratricopeptide (TPR) repeat protein
MKNDWKTLGVVCALVIGIYAYMSRSGPLELQSPDASDTYYNLLVRGFRAGRLSLEKEVPPGLAQLADPYNPTANAVYRAAPYRLHDLSYYKGKLYLYFGVTPALVLFWPYVALTGHYLFHRQAVAIFCTVGFLACVGLLHALWRRYFAEVSVWVVAVCALTLGLATGVPVLLSRAEVYEVAISCGCMLTMLTLWAIWCALQQTERQCWWLSGASVAYGLAVGARPALVFGAVILLVPVAQAWRERRQVWTLLTAAIGPVLLIGLGLMLYNTMRFDSPFEFGLHYQLGLERQFPRRFFSLQYLLFNFRVCFLEPVRWSARFPFVHGIAATPVPSGHGLAEGAFGVLTNIPLVWLALAAPLAWRSRSGQAAAILQWFVTAVALLFGVAALTIGLYLYAAGRYEVEFLPALLLLAVVGILGLERVLAPTSESGLAGRPGWRCAARLGWSLLLAFSVAFNLLVVVGYYAETHYNLGIALANAGRTREAIEQFEQAVQIEADYDQAHVDLGNALLHIGKVTEAIAHYEQALRINPDYAAAHVNLGMALVNMGKVDEAMRHYRQALRINPDLVEAYVDLGNALLTEGKGPEAMAQYEEALRINPDYPQAHVNLGMALAQAGMMPEAMKHWEEALRIRPDDVLTQYNLGNALERQGHVPEAIEHYRQALKLRPDFIPAQDALTRLGTSQ